jgi:DNA-binding NarL/FixJ family response regulator
VTALHDRQQPLRCLVADDHPAVLMAIQAFLEDKEIEVVAAVPDGESAVEAAREAQPDVALVDFRMPGLGGVKLLQELRKAAPQTRLVVFTGAADERVVNAALSAGADAVVLKEAPLVDLMRALDWALAGRVYVDPALAHAAVSPGRKLLTDREADVLRLLAEGLSHEEIAGRLEISSETVRTHVRNACGRLRATSRTEAVATALRLGLIG